MERLARAATLSPEVSIIIINWNSAEYVRRCLQSIEAFIQKIALEVIVFDSASHDGCGEMLARDFPQAIFMQGQVNAGFARANNEAVRQARGRFIWLLNPDTELREDSLAILLSTLQTMPRAGAVGCRLLNRDGSLQTSCVQPFPTVVNQLLDSSFLFKLFPHWKLWAAAPLWSKQAAPAQALSGACILIPRQIFDLVGGFTESYFMYGEDLDLCFKVRAAGFEVYHTPATAIVHFGGGSTERSPNAQAVVLLRQSVYHFLRRNRGWASAACYRAAMALAAVVRMLFILPLLALSRKTKHQIRFGSLRKWLAILRWSVGLHPARPNSI